MIKFYQKIACIFLLHISISLSAQIDADAIFTLPTVGTSVEMNSIVNPNTGSLVFNNEDRTIYYFDGTTWLPTSSDSSANTQHVGLRYYTWNINNTTSPNICNRNLGVIASEGTTNANLDDSLRASIAPDNQGYILLFTGVIKVQNAGSFTFSSTSDDGSRIYIDNRMVLESWYDQGSTTRQGTVNLTQGDHVIEFWYYEHGGFDFMRFTWGANPDGYLVGSTLQANQFYYLNK